jgi:Lanthionine synthetase C-like protein
VSDRSALWRGAAHEQLTGRPWNEASARGAIDAIIADAEAAAQDGAWPTHPLDELDAHETPCAVYLGSGGVIWALWRLGGSFDGPAAVAGAIDRYRRTPDFGPDAHPPSLLMGETGLLIVADRMRSPSADAQRLRELVHENRAHPTWELLWGSPGTMLAARACGLDDEWVESARLLWAAWDGRSDLWTQVMYGQTRQYLGAGHGLAANVHALRGFVSDEELGARATGPLRRLALREDDLVNWPPNLSDPPSAIRVQWCHGAPGIISTIGDLIPLELALGGGELIWRAGPLRKGAGLCHGTAGNGFAFLKLYDLTGDAVWLERARGFAMHAIEQVERDRVRYGRGRYSLFTGDLGVALYLRACLDGVCAFPFIDTF